MHIGPPNNQIYSHYLCYPMKPSTRPSLPNAVPAKIFMPVLLSMFLFIGTFFGYILPKVETHLMDRKREMIHALSESAMGSIRYYAKLVETHDISKTEAQLQAASHLKSLRYGPDGKDYFWINDTHPRMIMHPYRPDLVGKDVTDTKDPAGKKLFQAFLETVKTSGGGYVNYHWQWQDDPSRIFSKISYVQEYQPWHWIVGTGVYVEDVRNQIAAITERMTFIFLGILAVIALLSVYVIWQGAAGETHRREIEESLKKSEHKYRLLAETAREIILLFNSDFTITYANTAWTRISNYTQKEMVGRSVHDFIKPGQRNLFKNKIRQTTDKQSYDQFFETELILKNKSTITVEASFAGMETSSHGTTFLMTARDITEKKKIETQTKMHQEQLMQTDKMVSLGTLVSGVAHEINNPISSVMLNIQVFEKFWRAVRPVLDNHYELNQDLEIGTMSYPQIRERMPKLLQFSEEGVERVKRIVGDLKDFSGHKPSDLRETVNLNEVVEKAMGLISSLTKKATNDLQIEYSENLPTLQGNSQRLGQVVINLIVNGCQALGDSKKGLHLATGYLEESEEIFFEVRDFGTGMSPEVLSRIKDPFYTTKRDSNGTGLGLSISDTIVRNHGGWLDFTSKLNEGTTATLLLPRYSNDEIQGRMI
ncbi:MAG: PAS domain S-box-containing protein [Desulforhopalus sp.]|jgi:PAS domain S-box-containing protein